MDVFLWVVFKTRVLNACSCMIILPSYKYTLIFSIYSFCGCLKSTHLHHTQRNKFSHRSWKAIRLSATASSKQRHRLASLLKTKRRWHRNGWISTRKRRNGLTDVVLNMTRMGMMKKRGRIRLKRKRKTIVKFNARKKAPRHLWNYPVRSRCTKMQRRVSIVFNGIIASYFTFRNTGKIVKREKKKSVGLIADEITAMTLNSAKLRRLLYQLLKMNNNFDPVKNIEKYVRRNVYTVMMRVDCYRRKEVALKQEEGTFIFIRWEKLMFCDCVGLLMWWSTSNCWTLFLML